MDHPRLPDWLVYLAVVAALLAAAVGRQERANAPPAPPPMPADEGVLLGPVSPFDPQVVVKTPAAVGPDAGTAFSLADSGVWMTARHVVEGCGKLAIVVAPGRGVATTAHTDPRSEAAVLITRGGSPALPLVGVRALRRGARAFHPGFPQNQPGEATSRLIGRERLITGRRGPRGEPVLGWAEAGRTGGLSDDLSGLSGAPALDGEGRVIGVTVAQAPRRGRLYTTTPSAVREALAAAGVRAAPDAAGRIITTDNYGRVADDLRRALSVAQVVCLAR
jgi:S1-C subfamily serine protease